MRCIGPLDHWQHEIRRMPRTGLIDMIEWLAYLDRFDRNLLLAAAKRSKSIGRAQNVIARIERYNQDPEREIDRMLARRKAAKKAARARKRNR